MDSPKLSEQRTDKKLWLSQRQALLLQVDNIEQELGIERTSDMRRFAKEKSADYESWKRNSLTTNRK